MSDGARADKKEEEDETGNREVRVREKRTEPTLFRRWSSNEVDANLGAPPSTRLWSASHADTKKALPMPRWIYKKKKKISTKTFVMNILSRDM